ncbi:hypothetical protein [Variovorax saccharolyticus]|uniref:hypothetical protein n=1 Tax=Variovorax saccharolyticus TaxID=3053516 RepID=UPI0025776468|nr:hypothetical protein [Variovorax sp. J31P216]MDM0029909.1 hypothetical protein [Variovorax sp. J31P216]
MNRIRDNDLAFAALPLADKKAEPKGPRCWLTLQTQPRKAPSNCGGIKWRRRGRWFKCKLTSARIPLIPAPAEFCTELHVKFSHGAPKFEGAGRLAAVGRGGPMEGYFSLWLPNRPRRQHVEIVDPEILGDGRLWRGQRKERPSRPGSERP